MTETSDPQFQVFISHTSTDKGIARDLCKNLENFTALLAK